MNQLLDPTLEAMPRQAAIQYCQQRIEECIRALAVADGRVAPERPRIQLASCLPVGLRKLNGSGR